MERVMTFLTAMGYVLIVMTVIFVGQAVRKILPKGTIRYYSGGAAVVTAGLIACSGTVTPHQSVPSIVASRTATARYTFQDEFTGTADTQWQHVVGTVQQSYKDKELEAYSDGSQYAHLDGSGNLVMTALKDKGKWTSAELTTQDTFSQYRGTFSARIRFPDVKGMWPAFWLLGPGNREVDIAELYGNGTWQDNSTVHGRDRMYGTRHHQVSHQLPSHSPSWHVFSVTWSSSGFTFSEDGVRYASVPYTAIRGWGYEDGTGMHMVLSLAVGGIAGGTPPTAVSSIRMMVDWVHVT
jgi:beta-glucanase (GH16 family)